MDRKKEEAATAGTSDGTMIKPFLQEDFFSKESFITETFDHFKAYGVKEGKQVDTHISRNDEHFKKALFNRPFIPECEKEKNRRFRLIIDYDLDFPAVMTTRITE